MAQKEVLDEYEKKIGTKKRIVKLNTKLKDMGKPTLLTNEIKLTPEEFKDLKALARTGLEMQDENRDLKKELNEVKTKYNSLVKLYNSLKDKYDKLLEDYDKLKARVQPYFDAVRYAPERVKGFIRGILDERNQEQERQRQERIQQRKSRPYDRGGR